MSLSFAILGAGGIAERFTQAVMIAGSNVVAVGSKSPERAKAFADKFGIAKSCTYDELVALPEVDVVYIATTNNFHYENIKLCLENGKHVICEKPMVLTEAEAVEMFALAKEKNLFLMEAMWSRFLPPVVQAKKWVDDGVIGKVQSVSAVIGFKSTRDPNSRLINPELAGGALYDIGVYPIEIVSHIVGEHITGVSGSCRKGETGVDENDTFVLNFETCDAAIQCLFTSTPKEYVIVNCEGGYIEIPTASVGDECFMYDNGRRLIGHHKERFPGGNGFVYEIREVERCIKAGLITSDTVPPYSTIECARVYDSLLR